jgi:hypothetical protein
MTTALELISSMAPREILAAAIALYQAGRAISIKAQAAGGVDVARRIAAGEAADIVVLSSDAIDRLVEGGYLTAASRIDLMCSQIAVAVPAGAPHPDLTDEKSVQGAVLAAASVSYSTGPSGRYLEKLFARRRQTRIPAVERTAGSARHRGGRASTSIDPVHHHVYSGNDPWLCERGGRPRLPVLPGLI